MFVQLEQKNWPSARRLAAVIHKSPDTVERSLKKLAAHSLAVYTEQGWCRGPASVEDVVVQLPSHGIGKRQKAWHEKERQKYYPIHRRMEVYASAPDPVWGDPELTEEKNERRQTARFVHRNGARSLESSFNIGAIKLPTALLEGNT